MFSKTLKIVLISLIASVSLNAYDVEQNGDWSYVYDGNDIVGAYSNKTWNKKYTASCGSPKLSIYENMYKETNKQAMLQSYSSASAAKNIITQYCKKR
ncbi:MAG: hypothetical protein GQ474_03780 [Sulfurimonas sp.]|nr:hypothetical protein [Sulfurimonas sp.]